MLARIDRGEAGLVERVHYGAADLLEYGPTTRANVATGWMTVEALAEAAITVSDNTAANLLLARIGGPAELTRFFRACGDSVTRLDRDEPTLNTNIVGDPRDTTSPRAMASTMRHVLTAEVLSPASRDRLIGWLKHCETGRERLRAGLPREWTVGDKTGTGANGAANDVAVCWPPKRAPIIIAAYLSEGHAEAAALNAAHARIARIVSASL